MVALEVAPEQLAQDMRHAPQGGVIDGELLLAQVIHDQVMDRAAGDGIPAEHLARAQLPLGDEHPGGGRGAGWEHAGAAEQLVEVHAPAAAAADVIGQAAQLHAVPGGDVIRESALGRHDDGDPPQRQVTSDRACLLGLAQPPEPGERIRIPDPAHGGGHALQAAGGQQPRHARADHVTADQQEQPGAQAVTWPASGAGQSCSGQPPIGKLPPRAAILSSRDDPAVLPGLAGQAAQPVQHPRQATPALRLAGRVVQGERRGEQPGEYAARVTAWSRASR